MFLYGIWRQDTVAIKAPQIAFDRLVLRRYSNQRYVLWGPNPKNVDQTVVLSPQQIYEVAANSAADVEVALARLKFDDKTLEVRLFFPEFHDKHIDLPRALLTLTKWKNELLVHATGVPHKAPAYFQTES